MLEVKLRLIEFMDSDPVDDCPLTVTARVAPLMKSSLLPPDSGDPGMPMPLALDQADGGNDTLASSKPHFSRAINIPQTGESGKNGIVALSFDVAEAFERVAKENPDAVGVKAYLLVEVACAGVQRRLNLLQFPLEADERFETVIVFDFAKAIIGHVTEQSARLWFQYHGELKNTQRFVCDIQQGNVQQQSSIVSLDAAKEHTAVFDVTGLQPATQYIYTLTMHDPTDVTVQLGRVIARGQLTTAPAQADRLNFVFGSCHQPVARDGFPSGEELGRWKALANREGYEFLLLMGDQIYGDSIEDQPTRAAWRAAYVSRYNQFWQHHPMRRVLRRTPTYMILDDHDVVDDFGTAINLENSRARVQAALDVYDTFQDSHNPPHAGERTFHYSFRRGPAAFFVMDVRTHREQNPEFPVLGAAQLRDLRRWASAAETRAADIIFVVSPVPLAFLPIQQLLDAAKVVAPATGAVAGALLGGAAGFILAGPGGAAVGAEVGAIVGGVGTAVAYESLEDVASIKADFRDQWDFENNQKDLVHVLELLFDLANDIVDGRPGSRPRAVFVLSGDAHLAAVHAIRSKQSTNAHDHRRNPLMYQLLSSGISRPAEGLWNDFFDALDLDITPEQDLANATLVASGFDTDGVGRFILDTRLNAHYAV